MNETKRDLLVRLVLAYIEDIDDITLYWLKERAIHLSTVASHRCGEYTNSEIDQVLANVIRVRSF